MEIKMILNNKPVRDEVPADMTLMEFVRKHGCQSVKCGCLCCRALFWQCGHRTEE